FSPIFPIFSHFSPLPPGPRSAPSVHLLAPPPGEVSGPSPTLSLTCLVRGFYPESISLQWQKNQAPLDQTRGQLLGPLKE
ncbi:IGHE protein, partial [Alcedo cyanopectus]|nr:IGHE protein [Ceyx cyanopectus]